MRNLNKINILAYISIIILFCFISLKDFLSKEIFISSLADIKTKYLYVEIISILLVLILLSFTKYYKIFYLIFIILLLQLHSVLLPLSLVFLYSIFLINIGLLVFKNFNNINREKESFILELANSFFIGSVIYIMFICFLSIFKIASIKNIQIFTYVAMPISFYFNRAQIFNKINFIKDIFKQVKKVDFIFIFILISVLLQAARLNLSIDYDSIRYALRSPNTLFINSSIYENPNLLNLVYVYPKGLEILTAFLNIQGTYSYIQAFSLLIYIFFLLLSYEFLLEKTNKKSSYIGILILSYIPAISSMAISSKTDMITLFIQVLAIINYLKNKKNIILSLSLLIISLIFKPTAIFFSVIIFICILYDSIINRLSLKLILDKKYIFSFILSILVCFLVNLRTFFITGHFFVSILPVFSKKFGFNFKYPYLESSNIPRSSIYFSNIDNMKIFIKRVYSLFISPLKFNEIHIYIAFAGSIVLSLLIITIINKLIFCKNKKIDFLEILSLVILIFSIYTLIDLYQIDGNYYILLYTLIIYTFVIEFKNKLFLYSKIAVAAIYLSLTFSFIIMSVTNWSGKLGLSEIQFLKLHSSHIAEQKKSIEKLGFLEIYTYLEEEKDERLLSVAEHDISMYLPSFVESYTDLVGSGGNVVLVKYLDNFKKYLDVSDKDYIFTSDTFLLENSRANEIINYMIEDKSLELVYSNNIYKLYNYKSGR